MAEVKMIRGSIAEINSEPIRDGQLLFTTGSADSRLYLDTGSTTRRPISNVFVGGGVCGRLYHDNTSDRNSQVGLTVYDGNADGTRSDARAALFGRSKNAETNPYKIGVWFYNADNTINNDKSWSFSPADYLPLAGGTMTGSIIQKSSNLDDGATPTRDAVGNARLSFYDKDNFEIGYVRPLILKSGALQGIQIAGKKTVNGSTIQNDLRLGFDADGNRKVVVADAAAWRTGISAAAANHTHAYAASSHTHSYLPLAGGTMTGQIKMGSATAMPRATGSSGWFPVVMDAFDDGGGLRYMNPGDVTALIGAAADDHTHTAASVGAAAASHTHSYIPLSGGTATGNIIIKNNTSTAYATTTKNYRSFAFSDSTGKTIAHTEGVVNADGSVTHNFAAIYGPDDTWHQTSMTINKSGKVSYAIHEPTAFLTALSPMKDYVTAISTTWVPNSPEDNKRYTNEIRFASGRLLGFLYYKQATASKLKGSTAIGTNIRYTATSSLDFPWTFTSPPYGVITPGRGAAAYGYLSSWYTKTNMSWIWVWNSTTADFTPDNAIVHGVFYGDT